MDILLNIALFAGMFFGGVGLAFSRAGGGDAVAKREEQYKQKLEPVARQSQETAVVSQAFEALTATSNFSVSMMARIAFLEQKREKDEGDIETLQLLRLDDLERISLLEANDKKREAEMQELKETTKRQSRIIEALRRKFREEFNVEITDEELEAMAKAEELVANETKS